jgi:hypothetical protein
MNASQFFYETHRKYHTEMHGQRMGQFYYNEFRKLHPSINIPDEADCFSDDMKLPHFCNFVGGLKL